MKQLLFLCTGNYYRSRFAELLFNALVPDYALSWQALSRGLATELETRTVGMSPVAVQALYDLGYTPQGVERYPLQVQEQDLQAAQRIIALKEAEHRPYLQTRHPAWVEAVEYWHIHDGLPTTTYNPLEEITRAVHLLCQQLAAR
ncbi:MAG: low molecular weight phosphatase family protein [Candidatus Tectimicrobiota bacterium]